MSFSNYLSKTYKYILPIGFSLIIVLMVLISLVAIIPLNNNSSLMLETAEKHSSNDELLRTMYQSGLKRSIVLFEMLHTNDPFEQDELYMQLNTLATKFTVARENLKNNDLTQDLKVLFDFQTQLARGTAPKQYAVYEYLQNNQRDKAIKFFIEETLPNSKIFLDTINKMSHAENLRSTAVFQQSNQDDKGVIKMILLFDIVSILASILLTLFIIKKQRAKENELTKIASTDTLTLLPNRTQITDEINKQIASKPDEPFAVIFFDIDYFKSINDNYGHEIGDEVLKRFSSSLIPHLNTNDVLSRFGGDEFVLLLRSVTKTQDVTNFIAKLTSILDTSFIINNNEIFISASIGIAPYEEDGSDAKTLLKNADVAMYLAKESGRNCFQFFSKESSDRMKKDHSITHALHSILKKKNIDKELYLQYQPLTHIENNDITECEALIRWKNEFGNNISPSEFIPLAEKSNLIEKINLFVIDEACSQQHVWQQTSGGVIRININLSGNKIIFKRLLERFHKNMKEMDLSPSLFGVELTERTLNQISEETILELDKMRKLGMKISIDDFGTDYSSLIYLKKLPVTTLKIDKTFISGLSDNQDDHALVKTIITLGHSLKLDVVAEGVETIEQLDVLKSLSCDIAQGYYFHRPLHGDQISKIKLAA